MTKSKSREAIKTMNSDSITDDMSTTSSNDISPTNRRGKTSKLKKRNRGPIIKDLSIDEQKKARNFDLDHNGVLDDAELAMMNYDIDGDGHLTATEVHA